MPHPPAYTGTQDNDQTRSVDIVHIEPSIREGVHLVSSLYGHDASRPLDRFPPVNTNPPFLVGSGVIPNRIVCEVGTWESSPSPDYYYQWMDNGVDLPGENSYEIFTNETHDGAVLTCEVRANNGIGEDYAISSNSITCSLIEPIENRNMDFAVVTGLPSEDIQTAFDDRTIIMSGLGTDNRIDVMRGVSYYLTGIGADDRVDINAMPVYSVTGIGQPDTLSVLERDYAIAVISKEEGRPFVDGEQQLMPLKNAGAESGTFGWTVFGVAFWGDEFSSGLNPQEGDFAFQGGLSVHPDGNNTPYTYVSQDVYLWDIWHADIDAGLCFMDAYWVQSLLSGQGEDKANVKVEFYANDGTTLTGFNDGPGLWNSPTNVWFNRKFEGVPIPPLTRYVRVFVEFLWDSLDDNDISAQIDDLRTYIRRGDLTTVRTFGPDFTHWRVRFTQSNTWSGGALSEVEFRGTPGGLDLATGGSVIFGSAGFGVANADAAFDDLINTNYWAGAENAIAEGTSWVGYQKAAPWRPEELSLVARQGSNALQMGQAFVVEGSDDGIRWDTVEIYDNTRIERAWNSGEARQFPINTGVMPYMMDGVNFAAPTFTRDTNSGDDMATKGCVFLSHAHIDISHLRFYTHNQDFSFRWQIAHISGDKSESWHFGVVSELGYDGIHVNAKGDSTPSNGTWQEIALPDVFSVNAGGYFLITFIDYEVRTSNPNVLDDPNEGRMFHVSNMNGFDIHDRNTAIRKINAWDLVSNVDLYSVGQTNPGGFQSNGGYTWGIDFRGNFF